MDINIVTRPDAATLAWQHRVEVGQHRLATTLWKIISNQEKLMTAVSDLQNQMTNAEQLLDGLDTDLQAFEAEAKTLFQNLQDALNANNMNGLADVTTRMGVFVTKLGSMRTAVQAATAADDPSKAAPPVVTPPPVTPPADPGTTPPAP